MIPCLSGWEVRIEEGLGGEREHVRDPVQWVKSRVSPVDTAPFGT